MGPHAPLSSAGPADFPATLGARPDFRYHVRPTARGLSKTKLKLETLILCDYTHFTGKTRGGKGRTVWMLPIAVPCDERKAP
jgi:hypothetical protein